MNGPALHLWLKGCGHFIISPMCTLVTIPFLIYPSCSVIITTTLLGRFSLDYEAWLWRLSLANLVEWYGTTLLLTCGKASPRCSRNWHDYKGWVLVSGFTGFCKEGEPFTYCITMSIKTSYLHLTYYLYVYFIFMHKFLK